MPDDETPFTREPAEGGREVIDKELAKMRDKDKATPADGQVRNLSKEDSDA